MTFRKEVPGAKLRRQSLVPRRYEPVDVLCAGTYVRGLLLNEEAQRASCQKPQSGGGELRGRAGTSQITENRDRP
jgi:hypothetical protein